MHRLAVVSLKRVLGLARRPPLSPAAAIPLAGSLSLGVACTELSWPAVATHAPFTPFYGAILVAGMLGGAWAGGLAIVASAGLGYALHVRTAEASSSSALAQAGGFLVVSGAMHAIVCALRFSSRRGARVLTDVRRRRAELADTLRTRDDFLAVAGHELKTPLTALQLQLEGLSRAVRQRRPGFEALAEERLAKGIGHLERLQILIRDMLDASRLLHNGVQLAREPLDLTGLVERVITRLAEPAARVGSLIQLEHDGPLHGEFDPMRLEQVTTHLVANAVKYGMGRPVEVQVRRDGDTALLRVRDGGIGMGGADAGRIFERFARAAPGENYGGLGLGLWVVRRIVESAGGSVEVVSAPGAGSTFTVRLPLGVEHPGSSRLEAARREVRS